MDLDGAGVPLQPIEVDWNVAQAQKGGYPYFMRKEIDEQPAAIRDTLAGRVHDGGLQLDELRVPDDVLREVSKVFVVACGTAFHSGLVAKYAIEHWTRLPVEIEIASEFRYRDPVLGPDTLTLAVSQSGETIDTLEAARHAARQGSQVLAVTNTVGSSLAREADDLHSVSERARAWRHGRGVDTTGLARMRLSEHAIHAWNALCWRTLHSYRPLAPLTSPSTLFSDTPPFFEVLKKAVITNIERANRDRERCQGTEGRR